MAQSVADLISARRAARQYLTDAARLRREAREAHGQEDYREARRLRYAALQAEHAAVAETGPQDGLP